MLAEKQQQQRLAGDEAMGELPAAASALARVPAGRQAAPGAGAAGSGLAEESGPSEAERAAANKAMGADPGDAVLGRGAEVNLDAQVRGRYSRERGG